jgi:hypothetical protein
MSVVEMENKKHAVTDNLVNFDEVLKDVRKETSSIGFSNSPSLA